MGLINNIVQFVKQKTENKQVELLASSTSLTYDELNRIFLNAKDEENIMKIYQKAKELGIYEEYVVYKSVYYKAQSQGILNPLCVIRKLKDENNKIDIINGIPYFNRLIRDKDETEYYSRYKMEEILNEFKDPKNREILLKRFMDKFECKDMIDVLKDMSPQKRKNIYVNNKLNRENAIIIYIFDGDEQILEDCNYDNTEKIDFEGIFDAFKKICIENADNKTYINNINERMCKFSDRAPILELHMALIVDEIKMDNWKNVCEKLNATQMSDLLYEGRVRGIAIDQEQLTFLVENYCEKINDTDLAEEIHKFPLEFGNKRDGFEILDEQYDVDEVNQNRDFARKIGVKIDFGHESVEML